MGKYKKYHSDVKTTYALGLQDELLPHEFKKEIPNSTSSYWKDNEKPERYVGGEFASSIQSNLNDTKVFLDPRVRTGKEIFIQVARFYITILHLIGKDRVFLSIQKNKNIVALFEIEILKTYMTKKAHEFWSIGAIWGKAVKDGAVSMSSASWYKYSRKLGYSEARKPKKKQHKRGSFNADRPNHTWHMDVSQYTTLDHVKFYIYTVVDNFSRKIVSHHISRRLSARIRVKSLRQAIKNEFDVEIKDQSLDLIVDGGSENNNSTVANFIKNCEVSIQKKIALKDVTFSNSIVEGPYKIMKTFYFRKKDIFSWTIKDDLEHFIVDYNFKKPCHKHKFFTPDEVHLNPDILEHKPIIPMCNHARLEANRNYCCKLLMESIS